MNFVFKDKENKELNPTYCFCVLASLVCLPFGVQFMLIEAGLTGLSALLVPFGIEFLLGSSFVSKYKREPKCQPSKRKR